MVLRSTILVKTNDFGVSELIGLRKIFANRLHDTIAKAKPFEEAVGADKKENHGRKEQHIFDKGLPALIVRRAAF